MRNQREEIHTAVDECTKSTNTAMLNSEIYASCQYRPASQPLTGLVFKSI